MGEQTNFIIYILITIGVFLLCREIVCWYFKLNKINDTLIEIRDLLKRNAEIDRSK